MMSYIRTLFRANSAEPYPALLRELEDYRRREKQWSETHHRLTQSVVEAEQRAEMLQHHIEELSSLARTWIPHDVDAEVILPLEASSSPRADQRSLVVLRAGAEIEFSARAQFPFRMTDLRIVGTRNVVFVTDVRIGPKTLFASRGMVPAFRIGPLGDEEPIKDGWNVAVSVRNMGADEVPCSVFMVGMRVPEIEPSSSGFAAGFHG